MPMHPNDQKYKFLSSSQLDFLARFMEVVSVSPGPDPYLRWSVVIHLKGSRNYAFVGVCPEAVILRHDSDGDGSIQGSALIYSNEALLFQFQERGLKFLNE